MRVTYVTLSTRLGHGVGTRSGRVARPGPLLSKYARTVGESR